MVQQFFYVQQLTEIKNMIDRFIEKKYDLINHFEFVFLHSRLIKIHENRSGSY
jgi:hypothetical protein